MKDRRKSLEQRVLGEVMGWHARRPHSLLEWLKDSPDALLANLQRIDNACGALLAERARIKKLRDGMNKQRSEEK